MPSITFTVPGAVKFTCPDNVDSGQVECWAAGQGGYPVIGASSGHGGGAAEYAAEPTLTLEPGMSYYGQVGSGGAAGGGAGGNTTWNGGQITAHGGSNGNGGTGSSNTVHHNGGAGGAGVNATGGFSPGGGGGGSSGAPSGAGNNGAAGTLGGTGGAGGAGLTSGGAGGAGGNAGHAGGRGGSPGGGGGGSGSGGSGGGAGGNGQIRITWAATPGSPSGYPLPTLPFFPAGYSPAQNDLNNWFHDPFAFLENRVVARLRQNVTPNALPSSGAATVIEYDTVDEDLLGGWVPAAWAWGPPAGFSGWYQATVTLYTAALASGSVIRPGLIAPGAVSAIANGYPGAAVAGVQGTYWVYLVGGQDTIQATGTLLNASSNVNTDVMFGQQSSMEITWLSS